MSDGRARDLGAAARAIEAFLEALGAPIGRDPELAGTGARVAAAFSEELLSGYALDPAALLAEATGSRAEGLVVVTDVPTTIVCPHHLLPATGVAHVGYWPGGRVVGFGALGALVDCHTRRLALQEDAGARIADALVTHLGARAAGVVLDLEPTCMTARGERRHGARAVTSAFAGEAATDGALRAELWAAVASRRGATGGPNGRAPA